MKLKPIVLFIAFGAIAILIVANSNQDKTGIENVKAQPVIKQVSGLGTFDPLKNLAVKSAETKVGLMIGNRRKVSRNKLAQAENLDGIIRDFPKSWISEYREVQLEFFTGTMSNQTLSCNSYELTKEQKEALQKLTYGDEFVVIVKYVEENHLTDKKIEKKMELFMKVTPETEAGFPGGYQAFRDYVEAFFEENDYYSELISKGAVDVLLHIDNEGVASIKNDPEMNLDPVLKNQLIDYLESMPRWQPAKGIDDISISQEITLVFGGAGC